MDNAANNHAVGWEVSIIRKFKYGNFFNIFSFSVFLLLFHILTQFSGAVTYNMFITLGLITSVPVSAGESNTQLNFVKFNLFLLMQL